MTGPNGEAPWPILGPALASDLAQEVLADLWGKEEKIIRIEHIQRTAAEFFGVMLGDMRAKDRIKADSSPATKPVRPMSVSSTPGPGT